MNGLRSLMSSLTIVIVLSTLGSSGGRSGDENLTTSISFDSVILSAVIVILKLLFLDSLGANTILPDCPSKSSSSARSIQYFSHEILKTSLLIYNDTPVAPSSVPSVV